MNVQTTIQQSVPERLARVRQVMAEEGIDALLVPSSAITWRTRATRSGTLCSIVV